MRMNVKYKYLTVIKNVSTLSGDSTVFVMRVSILVVPTSASKVHALSLSLCLMILINANTIYICSLRIWIPGNSARQYFTNKQDKNAAISFLIVDEVSSQCLGVADTCQYGCRVEGPRAFCYCPLGYTLNPDQATCTCMSLYNQYLIITLVQGQAILICYQYNLLYPVV